MTSAALSIFKLANIGVWDPASGMSQIFFPRQHVISFFSFAFFFICALALLALPCWDGGLLKTMSVTALKLTFERDQPTAYYKHLQRYSAYRILRC